ncbi:MipA/OmpV family protein [Pseudomonas sp. NPDC089530]|uniref:MipA/OmpV family protein n=1 Tax=Pseudomonas sp. NPDC089530 TaxID=3390651 RepID=UPI003D00BF94
MNPLSKPRTWYLSLSSLCLLAPGAQAEDWHYSLQLGAASIPRYSGSDERTLAPVLGGAISSPYGAFLNTEQGLGWQGEWGNLAFSTWVGPSETRKDRKTGYKGSDRLNGMGSIKSRAQVGANLSYTLGAVVIGATVEHAFKKNDDPDTGSAYNRLELNIATTLYKGDYGSLDGSLNSRFGDGDYMQTWYGVSRHQAANSRFSAYHAKGGMLSQGGDLTWSLPLNANTSLSTVLAVDYLGKEAGDSPIVDKRLQTSLAATLEYSF